MPRRNKIINNIVDGPDVIVSVGGVRPNQNNRKQAVQTANREEA